MTDEPDPHQLILGRDMAVALQAVGVLPDGVFTQGVRLNVPSDDAFTADVRILVPANKLREALDIVAPDPRRVGREEVRLLASPQLLAEMGTDWSQPVRVRVAGKDADGYTQMEFTTVNAL